MAKNQRTASGAIANQDLILPYLLPYGAYVLIGTLAGGFSRELDYVLRIVVVGALLLFFRSRYRVRGPRSVGRSAAVGALAGVAAAFVWVGLLIPFRDAHAGDAFTLNAFLLRLAAAVVVVPFAEELLCRGFILGLITQWQEARRAGAGTIDEVLDRRSVHELRPDAATALSIALSSAAFAIGHSPPAMLAAFGFGVVMALLWVARGDLVAPIVAHAVTNLVLYVYVFRTGSWGLW